MDIDIILGGQLGFQTIKDGLQRVRFQSLGVRDVESVAITTHVVIAKVACPAANRTVHCETLVHTGKL